MPDDPATMKAKSIVAEFGAQCTITGSIGLYGEVTCEVVTGELTKAIADALRVPAGCVRTPEGVDRKVLGTLPLTADGCVVGLGCVIYNARMEGVGHKINDHTLWGDNEPGRAPVCGAIMWPQAGRPNTWYSTPEAALATHEAERGVADPDYTTDTCHHPFEAGPDPSLCGKCGEHRSWHPAQPKGPT